MGEILPPENCSRYCSVGALSVAVFQLQPDTDSSSGILYWNDCDNDETISCSVLDVTRAL